MDLRVQVVISRMEDDLRRAPSLDTLAASVNLSDSRLRHVFKSETGMTPAQYLKALRMRKAHELLKTTFLRVKEVMNTVGLQNESHFVQDFKRAYGLTPMRYREQHLLRRVGKTSGLAGGDNPRT